VNRFFLNPLALVLGVLAGGIVLLYILKLKRVKVRVSSTMLWERAVHDFKANAPWQRLRRSLLLLLQILALLLLVLALARPFVFGTALAGARSVVIIDTSASMLATDERPDRLGRALDAAQTMIGDMSRGDEAMLIAAGPTPQVLASFTRDKGELLDALHRVRDDAGGQADVDAALRLAGAVTQGTKARVVVFSDGAVPELDPLSAPSAQLSFFPVGKSYDNVGIVSAGVRRNPFSGDYEVLAALHNFSGQQVSADFELGTKNDVLDVRPVELKAGERKEMLFTGVPFSPEPLQLKLDYRDVLAEDDTAYVLMPERVRYKVALCTKGESVLLRKALAALPDCDLYVYSGGQLEGPAGTEDRPVQVWVVEGDAPSGSDVTAGYLFFNTAHNECLPVDAGAEVSNDFNADPPVVLTIVGMDRASPLLRFLSIGDVRLKTMRQCRLKPWAKSVVDASAGPLIVEGDREGQRTVYVAFDIYDSDFPLRAAFPMFLANAIRYLAESRGANNAVSTPAGTRVDLLAPVGAQSAVITDPQGRTSTLDLAGRELTLGRTTRAGVYSVKYLGSDGRQLGGTLVPVSLVNDAESNITPGETLRFKGAEEVLAQKGLPKEVGGRRQVRVNREFYAWLILLVLAIISLEWYLYHTRAL